MQKRLFLFALVFLLAGFARAGGPGASTRFVVSVPEVLLLRINGVASGEVPVRVSEGQVSPAVLHVEVVANTGWRLTVRAAPLRGPLVLPAERLRLEGRPLSELEQTVRSGAGPAVFDLPLDVELFPGEPKGEYRSLLTFELYRL